MNPVNPPEWSRNASDIEDWGFITVKTNDRGDDFHDKYWFKSQLTMIRFICLWTISYVDFKASDEEWWARCTATAQFVFPTLGAFESESHAEIEAALGAIERHFGNELKFAWCGQFKDLLSENKPFSQNLRQRFFRQLKVVKPSNEVSLREAPIFEGWIADVFVGFNESIDIASPQ